MKGTRWAIAAFVLLVLAAGGWYFASPWWTLRQMQAAADANDGERLAAYIDFPMLRDDLRGDLSAQMQTEARARGGAFGGLAASFGQMLINPLVDNLVTPSGVRALFLARRQEAENDDAPPPAEAEAEASAGGLRGVRVGDAPVIRRRGLSEFVVSSPNRAGGLVFTRHGLGWRLSGIDLPPAGAAASPGTSRPDS